MSNSYMDDEMCYLEVKREKWLTIHNLPAL